jgi:hypothetical protein
MAYSATIKEASRNLTAKERIMLKDTTSAVKLDQATQVEDVHINVDMYAILNIHNDKADPKDYENYIILDKNGNKFVTGSASFWNAFMDIWTEMENENEEWSIRVYRHPSKNYSGKDFITCAIE